MTIAQVLTGGPSRPPAHAVRSAVHGSIVCLYAYTARMAGRVNWSVIDMPTISQVDKFLAFMLTSWTLSMQLLFFFIATLLDFLEIFPQPIIVNKILNKMRKVNDFFFMTMVLPLSMCVCGGFWAGWVLNSEGVYPSALSAIIPTWINHTSHTTPIFIAFFELIWCYHPSPKIKPAITCLFVTETIYLLSLVMLRVQHGRWVYLVIDIYVNSIPKIIIMFSFLSYIIPLFYLGGCLRFNNYFWGIKSNRHDIVQQRNKKTK